MLYNSYPNSNNSLTDLKTTIPGVFLYKLTGTKVNYGYLL